MGKGIGRIYKYEQRSWPKISSNTTFVLQQHSDTYIQTLRNSASNVSMGENYLSLAGLDKSTNHHGNIDINNYYYSQKHIENFISVLPFFVIQSS